MNGEGKRNMGSMIVSGVVTFTVGCASAVGFFFALVLALNGFMGQERAVNASFGTYAVLAVLIILITTGLSICATGFVQRRFRWHAILAVLLSAVTFSIAAGVLHLACVIVSAIVASELRTNK